MNSKLFKILIAFLLIIYFFLTSSSLAYSIENIFVDAKKITQKGKPIEETINRTELNKTAAFIFNLLKAIGIVILLALGIVLGIKFMVASADNKAKIKEALIAYSVSCLVFFSAYRIWAIAVNVSQDVVGEEKEDEVKPHTHEYVYVTSFEHQCSICDDVQGHSYKPENIIIHKCSVCGGTGEHIWSEDWFLDGEKWRKKCIYCGEFGPYKDGGGGSGRVEESY